MERGDKVLFCFRRTLLCLVSVTTRTCDNHRQNYFCTDCYNSDCGGIWNFKKFVREEERKMKIKKIEKPQPGEKCPCGAIHHLGQNCPRCGK